MHFLVGLRTDDYVILAADKSAFAFGAIVVSQGARYKDTFSRNLMF